MTAAADLSGRALEELLAKAAALPDPVLPGKTPSELLALSGQATMSGWADWLEDHGFLPDAVRVRVKLARIRRVFAAIDGTGGEEQA